MSAFNLLPWGRWGTGVQKYFGFIGENPIPTLTPELGVGVVLENDRPEWGYLKEEQICGTWVTQAGGVGTSAQFMLRNSAGSNVLAVVTSIRVYLATAGNLNIYINPAAAALAGGTPQNNFPRDLRRRSAANAFRVGTLIAESNASASVTGTGLIQIDQVNSTGVGVREELCPDAIVIPPGCGLQLFAVTTNITMTARLVWRERQLLTTET